MFKKMKQTLRSMPRSAANLLAKGEARTKPSELTGGLIPGELGAGAAGGGVRAEAAAWDGAAGAGSGALSGAATVPSSLKSLNAATSASFSTIMHNNWEKLNNHPFINPHEVKAFIIHL